MLPTTVLAMTAAGIAAILFFMLRPALWLRPARVPVRVRPSGRGDQASAAITMAAGTRVRDDPNRRTASDAQDLDRMNDDGARQMSRPPA